MAPVTAIVEAVKAEHKTTMIGKGDPLAYSGEVEQPFRPT
jgi:hypothetical protein